jgi:glycosyltransferase involved in cell wall biosynthesis
VSAKSPESVLMVGPDLAEVGGVAAYCRTMLANYPGAIEYLSFPVGLGTRPVASARVLAALAARLAARPGLVHINTSLNKGAMARDMVFAMLASSMRTPVLLFFHGWEADFLPALPAALRALLRRQLNRCAGIIVLAGAFRKSLLDLGVTCPIRVETTPCSGEPGPLRPSRPPAAVPNVLFLSRVEKEKGVFELLDACALLARERPIRLDIAGDGGALAAVRARVAAAGLTFVTLHGHVVGEAKDRLFAQADVFCLPSYTEGLPIAVLDALAHGVPVVVTPVGGLPDVLSEPANALFVEPAAGSIAAALAKLCADPAAAAEMGRRNRELAVRTFAPRTVAARLAVLHGELRRDAHPA